MGSDMESVDMLDGNRPDPMGKDPYIGERVLPSRERIVENFVVPTAVRLPQC